MLYSVNLSTCNSLPGISEYVGAIVAILINHG